MTVILHGFWSPVSHQFFLWGEHSPYETRSQNKPDAHPYACTHRELRTQLDALCPNAPTVFDQKCGLLLPSTQRAPLPSSTLLRSQPVPGKRIWQGWEAECLTLESAQALELLLDLKKEVDTPSLLIGQELWLFAEGARLALEIVLQGQIVPTLEQKEDLWSARWQPVPEGELPSRLETVVQELPLSGRAGASGLLWKSWKQLALQTSWAEVCPPSGPSVCYDFIWTMVDTLARGLLNHDPITRLPRGSTAKSRALAAWCEALQSPSPSIDAEHTKAVAKLKHPLMQWIEQAADRGPERLKVCFRLSSPEDEDGQWTLEPLAQNRQDQSTLIALDAAWRRGPASRLLGRLVDDPQKTATQELTRAIKLAPELEPCLQRGKVITLTMKQSWSFLRHRTPLLERAGFTVFAPSWWTKPARLGLHAKSVSIFNTGMSKDLFNFDWRVAMGTEDIDEEELVYLSQLKQPLVYFRGRWVELHQEDIGKALAFLKREQANPKPLGTIQALRMNSGLETVDGLPVFSVRAQGPMGQLLRGETVQTITVRREPRGFVGKLRLYQKRGLSWMASLEHMGLGALLADDMGLGKTIQVIALLVRERAQRKKSSPSLQPTLIICPMSLVGNWRREIERFGPELSVYVHHGAGRLKEKPLLDKATTTDVIITTYATATRDRDELGQVSWRRLVLDEAQNIKNEGTQQARAIKGLRSTHRLALTGTPVENRLSELWSLMDFLNPGLLGRARDFKRNMARPIEVHHDEVKAAQLRTLCGPFVLRRLKSNKKILRDLPEKQEFKTFCTLTQEQATLYKAILDESLESIEQSEGITRKGLILATMTRLKQVCNHPALFMKDGSSLPKRSGKLERLEELLREILAAGERALIFTQYVAWGHALQPHLQETLGREVLFLHGRQKRKDREEMVNRFQSAEGPPIFLISLKAGGTGLTLTAANHVIHYDRWWNPAVEDQATDRAYRLGQTQNVQVRKLISAGTLEERMDEMIDGKRELAQKVINKGEAGLTELSTKALREVLRLSSQWTSG